MLKGHITTHGNRWMNHVKRLKRRNHCSRCTSFHTVLLTHAAHTDTTQSCRFTVTHQCFRCSWPAAVTDDDLCEILNTSFPSFLFSRFLFDDLPAKRGVFWAGGHHSSSSAWWPKGTAGKALTTKRQIQKFQRQHKAALFGEKACAGYCA